MPHQEFIKTIFLRPIVTRSKRPGYPTVQLNIIKYETLFVSEIKVNLATVTSSLRFLKTLSVGRSFEMNRDPLLLPTHPLWLSAVIISDWPKVWLIDWVCSVLTPFSTLFQLYRGSQLTYRCFSGVLTPVRRKLFFPRHWVLSHIIIIETMDSGERGMDPVAMTIINPRKEYWSHRESNKRPSVLKSCRLQATDGDTQVRHWPREVKR